MNEELTQNLPQDGVKLILARLDSIDSRLSNVENRLSTVENRLSTLEDKVDRRLQETRPIWEQVLVRLDKLEGEVGTLRDEFRIGLRRFERQVGLLAKDVMEARADQFDLDRRMDQLEPKPTQ